MVVKSESGYGSSHVEANLKRLLEKNKYERELREAQSRGQTLVPPPSNPAIDYPGYGLHKFEDYSSAAQPQDPISQILAQLRQLMGGEQRTQIPKFTPIQMPQFNPNAYKQQAEAAVNAEYNPIIQEIRNQQGATQKRSATNRAGAARDYAGMVASLNADVATEGRNYDAAQAQSKNLYTDERNRIAAAYAADAAAQREEAKRLGTEALGTGEAIAKQTADQRFADQLGSQQMQSSQTALEQQQQAAQTYDRQVAGATRAEGAEVQQDLARQLEDYMSESNTNLVNTQSQRAQSLNSLMMQLAQAAYQRDVANTQFGYQQQRDFIGDQNALYDRSYRQQQDQLDLALKMMELQGAASQSDEKLNPWQQAATFAEQLRPGQGSNIIAAIQGAMQRPEISARSKGDPVAMNPALFARLIADDPASQGLDRNSLMQVAQEIYRLLYGVG